MRFSKFATGVAITCALSVSSAGSASEVGLKEVATEHSFLRSDRQGWNKVYDATVIGRDGYGDWGYGRPI